MNNDLISREALKKELNFVYSCAYIESKSKEGIASDIIDAIDNAPTIDIKDIYQEGHYDGHLEGYTKAINEERPQGEWLIARTYRGGTRYTCSNCGRVGGARGSMFCPNCGAKMKKGGAE